MWHSLCLYEIWWLWLQPFQRYHWGPQNLQVAQLSQTNPRDTLHHEKRQNFKTISTPLLLVICHPVVRIDITYSCTKVDDFRFSRSSDMIGAPKILYWVTRPDHATMRDNLSSVGCYLHIQTSHQICSLCDRQCGSWINDIAFIIQFKHKRHISSWLYLIYFCFTTGRFACVYSARKLTIFHFYSWLSFQRLRRLLWVCYRVSRWAIMSVV